METATPIPTPKSFKTEIRHRLFHWSVPAPVIAFTFAFLVTSILGLTVVSVLMNRNHTALTNTLCVANASSKTTTEVARTVNGLIDQIRIDITVGDQVITAYPEDLGFEIDTETTISNIIAVDQQANFFNRIDPFPTCSLDLVATYSPANISDYLEATFPDLTTTYRDVSIYFDGTNYVVDPGAPGTRFDISQITAALDEAMRTPRALTATANVVETQPQTPRQTADTFAATLNQALDQSYKITSGDKTQYTLSRADIASVITVVPDPDDLSYTTSYNRDALVNLIESKVVKPLTSGVRTQVEYVYPNGTKFIATKGTNGKGVTNPTAIVDQLLTGIQDSQPVTAAANVSTTKYTTQTTTVDGDRWIDVNLTRRVVTLYNGSEIYKTFKVGIGKPSTPTITGNFVVYRKVAGPKCMSGDQGLPTYYNLCNIHWTSYFSGSYAFHEAWWTNAHNQPAVSHGCINMTKADAKTLYDFAPIGTPVYVHR